MNCENVHDSMIVKNRWPQQEKAVLVASSEPDYLDEEIYLGAESFLRLAA